MSPPPDPGPIVIGLREIYDKVASVEGKLGSLISEHSGTARVQSDHEQRLRQIEANRWPVSPLTMLVSVFALLIAGAALLIPLLVR